MKPLIGITAASKINAYGWEYNSVYAKNLQAITRAGGLPVVIPTGLDTDDLHEIYERMDAILLPGGVDVNPREYHAERHPKTLEIDDARDALELTIARWAVADDVPIIGICRGHQVLNVALGGTLIQDVAALVKTDILHDAPDDLPRNYHTHSVEIDPGSHLASILGKTHLMVNSLHHQSVEQAAPIACVTAYAPDGVIEALEVPDKSFALSVQWHPEDLQDNDVVMQRLFRAFVEAASERVRV